MLRLDELSRCDGQYYIQVTSAPLVETTRVLKHDDTFGVFDQFGDIDSIERIEEGVYNKGTRFLSSLKLKLLRGRPFLLSSTIRRDNVAGRFSSSDGTRTCAVMIVATSAATAARNGRNSTSRRRSGGCSTSGSS